MPIQYITEMILDWIAMGYQFHEKVYDYYEKHKKEKQRVLSVVTQNLVEQCMEALKEYNNSKEDEE